MFLRKQWESYSVYIEELPESVPTPSFIGYDRATLGEMEIIATELRSRNLEPELDWPELIEQYSSVYARN